MQALAASGGAPPKLAVVFASASYEDLDRVGRAVRDVVGDTSIVGGTSGACVFGGADVAARGVSVVLLGGDDLEVLARRARLSPPSFVDTVPAAEEIARAADEAGQRGLEHFVCLSFAPGQRVDGEAFVAAVRKGAGARARLAGALTGDDLTMDRSRVVFGDELHDDSSVIVGLYSRHPIGIAARHGYRAVGPARTVTRAEGMLLVELDGRRALDVWLEDARRAGATVPHDPTAVALYLANHYELGMAPRGAGGCSDQGELVARAPFAILEGGVIQLSASIAEGTSVRVLHASRADLLRASTDAAEAARADVEPRAVAGALVLACAGRLAALGDGFPEEPRGIVRQLGAPIGGACVFGEIARNSRDLDAFFNTTAVVVAFAA